MKADERFYPKEMKIDFKSHKRHYERYFKSLEIMGVLGKKETWLDCACGSGYGTSLLANFTKKIYGYDISDEAISLANKSYKDKNIIFTDNINKIKKNSIDRIFSIETIEHMPEYKAVDYLLSLKDLLNKNGKMIITTPIVEKTCYSPKNIFHHIEYCNDDFKKLLTEAGFKVILTEFVSTVFTDGEMKDQGYYLCRVKK